jgi:hypothetical protein
MKNVIALFLALAVATPAVASGRDHYKHGGYNNHRVQHHHHKHGDKWVVPLIGGVILGAVINEANKPKVREVVVVKQKCEPITIIVQDQWGRTIERRTEERCVTVY